jgi:hypothetical protein
MYIRLLKQTVCFKAKKMPSMVDGNKSFCGVNHLKLEINKGTAAFLAPGNEQ